MIKCLNFHGSCKKSFSHLFYNLLFYPSIIPSFTHYIILALNHYRLLSFHHLRIISFSHSINECIHCYKVCWLCHCPHKWFDRLCSYLSLRVKTPPHFHNPAHLKKNSDIDDRSYALQSIFLDSPPFYLQYAEFAQK